MNRLISLRAITFAIFFPTLVLAAPCKGPAPASGTPFAGTVRYISDGNRICVGASGSPASWIKVRLADFNPPELREPGGEAAKRTLETIALGKEVQCIAGKRSYDSVVARCTLGGTSIGDLMKRAGVQGKGRRICGRGC